MQFMILARYSQEVVKGIILDPAGIAVRDQHAFKFYSALGGKIVNYWFTKDIEYNFAIVVDFPDAEAAHAAVLTGYSTGAFLEGKLIPLCTTEELVGTLTRAQEAAAIFYPPTETGGDEA
ncbi:GYD domain-containing protein [Streptomyces sp. NA04227]|uniref:GYD domain-containing protein n=1 Tax=Streptomyces sp. NA04227 TaxID=2742136 RepID=UPI00158FC3EE|nr:GYD domain-containing protein [Streptomyces sp. NA04227]QKW09064.1 GYD domain-containing protein [Streptomyces sp. NA04227]